MKLLTEWVKPSGVKLELNDDKGNVEYARSLGWELYSETEEGLAEAKEFLAEQTRRAQATVDAAEAKQAETTEAATVESIEKPRRGRPPNRAA